ncbi:MAG: hypothetical protein JW806_03055 [Sedimentisphaerales bacterium]|nr:hypothetical protein [Sedimentisphaerales bacterium]
MQISKRLVFSIAAVAAVAALAAGCGGIAAIGTETASEKEIPAEFHLRQTKGKILVFVNQPGWVRAPMDLRTALTDSFNMAFEHNVGIAKERLIPYSSIMNLRTTLAANEKNDAFKAASKLGAEYVLSIEIMEFELTTFSEKDFFNGAINTKSCLYNSQGEKLWPKERGEKEEACKILTLGFEARKETVKSAVDRLANATAHCVTRYFYNCKKIKFRIAEEHKEFDYYKW